MPVLPELPKLCSAAGNAPSMAYIAILTASLAYLNHTCCKFGKSCPTCCKFGSAVPAVPTWRISGSANLASFWQHCFGSTVLAALRQSKSLRCLTQKSKNSMFHLRSMLFFYSNSLFYLPIRHYSLSPPVALVAESDSPASDASGHTQSVNAG